MESHGTKNRDTDDLSQPKATGTQRRRAPKACQFCRLRKLKCDNVVPQCANCASYAKECTYIELPKKERPSSAKIARLERETKRLQAQLQLQGQGKCPSTASSVSNDVAEVNDADVPSVEARGDSPSTSAHLLQDSSSTTAASSSRFLPSSDSVNYYGRTSALFEDGGGGSHHRSLNTNNAGRVSVRTELILMGEAARQRQMETINYGTGHLDFDGVEPELGMHLLSLHWNRQHHSSLITYRPAFMRDMACEGPYFSKLLLNAIYFGASKFSTRPEMRNNRRLAAQPFRQRVRELLGEALDRSKITTIQALLIMTSSLFALGDERSASWLYAGTAFRMIIDLGLHIDDLPLSASRKLTEEDFEIRRRVFWGAFVVDKIQSLYQGRPMSLQEADTRVPTIFQDNYEELEIWHPQAFPGTQNYPGSSTYSVSTFTELCKLSVIMNDILNKVYAEKTAKRAPERLAEDLKSLHSDLEKWETALPNHLRFENIGGSSTVSPPHVLSLQAMHKVLLILLHRPFVSEGHLHLTSPSTPADSFVICAMAATKIVQLVRIYDRTFSIQQAPYLMSYATYVSATIHVRIASQRGPGSEAHTSLATCLSVLGRNEETNWAVQRARIVILNLMTRMNVVALTTTDTDKMSGDSSVAAQTTVGEPFQALNAQRDGDSDERWHTEANANGQSDPVAGDLDMEAIIQSFIREQQNTTFNTDTRNLTHSDHQPFTTSSHPHASAGAGVMQSSFDIGYIGSSAWNEMDFSSDGTVHDTLFGFNGEALDGLW